MYILHRKHVYLIAGTACDCNLQCIISTLCARCMTSAMTLCVIVKPSVQSSLASSLCLMQLSAIYLNLSGPLCQDLLYGPRSAFLLLHQCYPPENQVRAQAGCSVAICCPHQLSCGCLMRVQSNAWPDRSYGCTSLSCPELRVFTVKYVCSLF